MTNAPVITLSPEDHAEIVRWLDIYPDELPDPVRWALQTIGQLVDALHGGARKLTTLLNTLRREMGIDPKSERQPAPAKLSPAEGDTPERGRPEDPVARLREKQARLISRRDWHKGKIRRRNKEIMTVGKQIGELENDATEPELTSEEEAALLAQESEALRLRFESGDEPDPSLNTAREALMTGNTLLRAPAT